VTKILFFDAAGTLFHLPKGVGWHYRDVAIRFGCHLDAEVLSRTFRTVWKQMPVRPATRSPRLDDDKGWWFSLVEQVLDQCGISEGQLPRVDYFEQLYTEFTRPGIWELYPETLAVLTQLRGQYRLGLISNFDGRLRPILANLGLQEFFDPIVISSEVGADKPDPWIFQQALTLAGIVPGEAVHVGDEPRSDWQGAAAAGIPVFRLERSINSLRDLPRIVETLGRSAPVAQS
jgi:putative hydrolase of the HAD superfamily